MTSRRSFLKGLVAAAAGAVARIYPTPDLPAPVELVVERLSILDEIQDVRRPVFYMGERTYAALVAELEGIYPPGSRAGLPS